MAKVQVTFLNGGFCRQLQRLVDGRTWRIVPFHAVFLALRHPQRGLILIDTGYSDHFKRHTRRFPARFYGWATPVRSPASTPALLARAGFDPTSVREVILTHFHADHIGGTRDFPQAVFHHASEALEPLLTLSSLRQTVNAFVPALLPPDFRDRSRPIPRDAFSMDPTTGLLAHDVFGDGSVRLVCLPGHAPGHLGALLEDEDGPMLYAADAYWHYRQIEDGVEPAPPARIFIHDWQLYRQSVSELRRLARAGIRLAACHCPMTQKRVVHAD